MASFDKKLVFCINCGSSSLRGYHRDFRGINIDRCNECGLQFMNPQYTDKHLTDFYSTYSHNENFEYWHQALLYGHDYYLSIIERFAHKGALLDFGCGNGHFLEAAIRRRWNVTGYDVDEKSTEIVAKRLGVKVYSGDFFSAVDSDTSVYDLVTLHQVLEHLKNPVKYLNKIHDILKPGGHVFVAVPNIMSLSNRIKFHQEKLGIRRKNIGRYYDTDHHLVYFSPRTLRSVLENCGFTVIYRRNGHKANPKHGKTRRFLMRNLTDHLFPKATFFLIAQKVQKTGFTHS